MSTLLDDSISIPADAYGAEPLAAAEIDAHPDRARLWATIRAMRAAHEAAAADAEEEGYRRGLNSEP